MNDEKCETCKFWVRDDDYKPGLGDCRLNGPKRHENLYIPLWPVVSQDKWCGEWKPRIALEVVE